MDTHGGEGAGEDLDVNRAGCRQSIRAKRRNRIRVRRIAVKVVRIRRSGVDDSRVDRGRRIRVEAWKYHQPGIVHNISRNGEFFLVIVQAVAATEHESIIEFTRTPGKADLGSEVILLCVPGVRLSNSQASQVVCPSTGEGPKHVVLFGGDGTKGGPAQSQIDRQVPAEFDVILGKEAQDVFALILANRSRETGIGIEASTFVFRRI